MIKRLSLFRAAVFFNYTMDLIIQQRLELLRHGFFERILPLDASITPLWGKMNLQQMLEHLSDSVRIANGKDPQSEILTPAERLSAVQDFLKSEKEFRPGTKNALLGEEPLPVRNPTIDAAVKELKQDVEEFIQRFESEPGLIVRNPFFGDLDFNGWTALFHKHFLHHLRQFNAG